MCSGAVDPDSNELRPGGEELSPRPESSARTPSLCSLELHSCWTQLHMHMGYSHPLALGSGNCREPSRTSLAPSLLPRSISANSSRPQHTSHPLCMTKQPAAAFLSDADRNPKRKRLASM